MHLAALVLAAGCVQLPQDVAREFEPAQPGETTHFGPAPGDRAASARELAQHQPAPRGGRPAGQSADQTAGQPPPR